MSDLELPPGSVIGGKYTVVDTLGVGGSGAVYRAQEAGMTRQVAVKLMHASHEEGESEKKRFAREAEVVKKLQHPNVVGLLDYGHHDDGTPFLVQPLLEGETLEQKVEREGAFNWEVTGRISLHVLKALENAHAMDIAHRDIKPANIFVTTTAFGLVAQVLDFGLAKVVRGDLEDQLQVTRVGAVLGTPRYMAPEQARGEAVGQSADIYSFGLVMAEMLLGKPIIEGSSDVEIYAMQGSDRPLRLPPRILQSPFASVIQRAVAKPLDVRYRLASQMLADVSALAERIGGVALSQPAEADLDATRMIDPAAAIALSTPNETSEKLRNAFNVIAKKKEAAEAAASKKPEDPALDLAATMMAPPRAQQSSQPPGQQPAPDQPPQHQAPQQHQPQHQPQQHQPQQHQPQQLQPRQLQPQQQQLQQQQPQQQQPQQQQQQPQQLQPQQLQPQQQQYQQQPYQPPQAQSPAQPYTPPPQGGYPQVSLPLEPTQQQAPAPQLQQPAQLQAQPQLPISPTVPDPANPHAPGPTVDMAPAPPQKNPRGLVIALIVVLVLLAAAIAALVYLLTLGK